MKTVSDGIDISEEEHGVCGITFCIYKSPTPSPLEITMTHIAIQL